MATQWVFVAMDAKVIKAMTVLKEGVKGRFRFPNKNTGNFNHIENNHKTILFETER